MVEVLLCAEEDDDDELLQPASSPASFVANPHHDDIL